MASKDKKLQRKLAIAKVQGIIYIVCLFGLLAVLFKFKEQRLFFLQYKYGFIGIAVILFAFIIINSIYCSYLKTKLIYEKGKTRISNIYTNQDLFRFSKIGNGNVKYVGNQEQARMVRDNLLMIISAFKYAFSEEEEEAIVTKCKERNLRPLGDLDDIKTYDEGLIGKIKDVDYTLGSRDFMIQNNINIYDYDTIVNIDDSTRKYVYIARQNKLIGVITFVI